MHRSCQRRHIMKWLRIVAIFALTICVLIIGAQQLKTGFAASASTAGRPVKDGEIAVNQSHMGVNPVNLQPGDGMALNLSAPQAPSGSTTCGGVYTATADVFIRQSQPGVNFDGDALFVSQSTPTSGRERILLKFDPYGAIPDGATVQRAELEFNLYQDPSPLTYTLEIASHQNANWMENTVTWNNQPTTTVSFDPVSYAITLTEPITSVVRLDVTTWAILWANGAITNTGLTIAPVGDEALDVGFYSRDLSSGIYAPRLVIYCNPANNVIPADTSAIDTAQLAGLDRLAQDSLITQTIELVDGGLRFASFQIPIPDEVEATGLARAQWFTNAYSDALRISDPDSDLQLVRRSTDDQHIFFRQLHRSIPVYPTELGIHLTDGYVTSVSGGMVPEITVDFQPRLSARQAEKIALAIAELETPGLGAEILPDTQLTYLNQELIDHSKTETYLTWRVNISDTTTAFIDANSGKRRQNLSGDLGSLHLDLETGNSDGPATWCGYWSWKWADDYWCGATGCNSKADWLGGEAWWSIRNVWVWWASDLYYDSFDGHAQEIEMYIHVGTDWNNAHYLPSCEFFEFGAFNSRFQEVVGHEFTHGVIRHKANLVMQNDPGALNESLADIFGYFAGGENDWVYHEEGPDGGRSFINPRVDHFSKWLYTDDDHGGVHLNSEIHNKVAYLITAGGQHYGYDTTPGIGKDKAKWLFWNMIQRMSPYSNFTDARYQAIQIARDFKTQNFLGFNTKDICIIMRAYASINIGRGDSNCDGIEDSGGPDWDNDKAPDSVDNCPNDSNPKQEDFDHDYIGDACDDNSDGDVFLDNTYGSTCSGGNTTDCNDNCPLTQQADQADRNINAIGDACDDPDGDGVMDSVDNCWDEPNTGQKNFDHDPWGDACDTDDDNDGIPDTTDNCPNIANPDQKDQDVFASNNWFGDGIGNACDLCPTIFNSFENSDIDHDGKAPYCDDDDDGDGILDDGDLNGIIGTVTCKDNNNENCDDNCPLDEDAYQTDLDGDGIGMVCDPDDGPDAGQLFQEKTSAFLWIPGEAFTIDLPGWGDHPDWGDDYLPSGFQEKIGVISSQDVFLAVVDSNGMVVAKSAVSSGSLKRQFITFEPAPYSFMGGISRISGEDQNSPSEDALSPNLTNYYLQIYPADSSSLIEPVTFTLQLEDVLPTILYLPVIVR